MDIAVLFALELLVKILPPHLYYLYRKCQNTTFEAVLIVYSLPYLSCWYSCVARIFLRIQQQVNIGNVSWKWTPPRLSKNLHQCHSRMVVPFNWAPIPERSWEPQWKKHIKDYIILFTGTESPPKVNTQISPHSTPVLIPVKCFKHNRLWSAVLSPFVWPSVLDQSCQSWKQRRCSAMEQLTILCLIVISPGVVTLCPTLKCLCIQSAIYNPLRFSLLTCQVVWSKAFKGCWKLILWTLTNTAITQPAHAIIWPEWTITPQPYLQSTAPTVNSEYTHPSCSIRRTTVSEHPGGRNPTELKWAP